MDLLLLILNKSFPKKRKIKPIGVTTIKNTTPIMRGEIIDPNIVPNLSHSLFNGVKNLEFKTPKIRKIIDKVKDQSLKSSPDFKGHKATIKNTTKNTNPKLRLDEIFILDSAFIINLIYIKQEVVSKLYLVN